MKEAPDRKRRGPLLLTALLLAAALVAFRSSVGLLGSGLLSSTTCRDASAGRLTIPASAGGGAACSERPRFRRYVPSVWEWEWNATATPEVVNTDGGICNLVAMNADRVQAWLAGCAQQSAALMGSGGRRLAAQGAAAADAAAGGAAEGAAAGPPDLRSNAIFSHFEYEDPCQPGAIISAPIEPLVGHFRHPAGPQCDPGTGVHIESRDYIMFLGLTPSEFQRMYPGRKLLMDFGSGTYHSSLGWILPLYESLGVRFDEVWAWEAAPVRHPRYWAEVPPHLLPRLHFYNTGLVTNTSSPDHPVHFIRQLVHPGDFLVIKLDVDNSPVELAFMEAIRGDTQLQGLIAEMFFEQHYKHKDMPWFGDSGDGISYRHVLQFFTGLRQNGLRLHYWP